jgi:sugar phosphate isomerase/epimerase
MDAMGLLEKAVALDVRVVQIADNVPLHTLPASELRALRTRAAELGISIEVGTRGIASDHLYAYLQLATRFKSPILRVVVDTAEHHPEADEVVTMLRQVIPEFERANVCLAIENHDRFKAGALAEIISHVGSRCVGVCLDTVNSFGALEGPAVVLQALGPMVVNLHVKEFIVERADHKMGFMVEGRPAGQGMLDVPWLLQELRDRGRDVNAILELWTPSEPNLDDTITKEDAWAATSVRYLRTLVPD